MYDNVFFGGGGGGGGGVGFFLVYVGREDPNTNKSGPSSACRRHNDPTLNAGLVVL